MFARECGFFVHEGVGSACDGLIWLFCEVLCGTGEHECDRSKKRMRKSRKTPRRRSFSLGNFGPFGFMLAIEWESGCLLGLGGNNRR